MKIVFFSDSHGYHHDLELPDGDILACTGDITLIGDIRTVVDFNEWIGKQPHSYKVVIGGNHDRCLAQRKTLGQKLLSNSMYLENDSVEIEGIKFWGSPYTKSFEGMRNGLCFYRRAEKMWRIWEQVPEDTDVLLTHGPPMGVLDKVIRNNPFEGEVGKIDYCGDAGLAAAVIRIKPIYHGFGHIHEHGGKIFKSDYGTTFINCSVVNENYNLVNKPVVMNI